MNITVKCGYVPSYMRSDLYYPESELCPEQIIKWGKRYLSSLTKDVIIITQSEYIINLLRYYKYTNKDRVNVSIEYYNKNASAEYIKITRHGKFDFRGENNFPSGFYDVTLKMIMDINKGKECKW